MSFLAVPMLKHYREKGLGSNFPSLLNCGHDNHLYKDKLYSIVLLKGIILLCDTISSWKIIPYSSWCSHQHILLTYTFLCVCFVLFNINVAIVTRKVWKRYQL